jgi:hypothetical protein
MGNVFKKEKLVRSKIRNCSGPILYSYRILFGEISANLFVISTRILL